MKSHLVTLHSRSSSLRLVFATVTFLSTLASLTMAEEIKGTILLPDGLPATNISVKLFMSETSYTSTTNGTTVGSLPYKEVTTDRTGAFSGHLEAGDGEPGIRVEVDGMALGAWLVKKQTVFRLGASANLKGKVLQADGQPAVGAKVIPHQCLPWWMIPPEMVTDEHGIFVEHGMVAPSSPSLGGEFFNWHYRVEYIDPKGREWEAHSNCALRSLRRDQLPAGPFPIIKLEPKKTIRPETSSGRIIQITAGLVVCLGGLLFLSWFFRRESRRTSAKT